MSQLDQMLAMLTEPAATKIASAPAAEVAPAAPAATAPAPAASKVAEAAAKIASAEDQLMRASAAEFGREFAKSAAEYFEKEGTFSKTASASGAAPDQAVIDAAFRAGMEKGASAVVEQYRAGYAQQLKVAHDLATVAHLTGQSHGAALRKIAADREAAGQTKEAGEGVPLVATLPFGVGPLAAVATAPAGQGLEAGLRSYAGSALGGGVGGVAGGLLGAGIGAGAAHLMGEDDGMAAAAMLGGYAGMIPGAFAGGMIGANRALQPIYAPSSPMGDMGGRTVTASADPYEAELMKLAEEGSKEKSRSSGAGLVAGGALGAGALGAGAATLLRPGSASAAVPAAPAPAPIPADFRVVPAQPPLPFSYIGTEPTAQPFEAAGPPLDAAPPGASSIPATGYEDYASGVSRAPADPYGFNQIANIARGAMADGDARHEAYVHQHPFHALWNAGGREVEGARHALSTGTRMIGDDIRNAVTGTGRDPGLSTDYVRDQASGHAAAAARDAGAAISDSPLGTAGRAVRDIHESMTPGVRSIARGVEDAYHSAAPHVGRALESARQGAGSLYDATSDWASRANLPDQIN